MIVSKSWVAGEACLTGLIGWRSAILDGANLTGADLTGANLSGASLCGINLTRVIGIGNKLGEIAFAKSTFWAIETEEFTLDMEFWHRPCETAHCIAGWAFPKEPNPGQKALSALKLVAAGELSVFPD